MRVITGTARGKRLKTLDGMEVRPTIDRVKEGLFSAIQFDLPGAVFLDLFSGSGQIGIEALSRGAEYAVFVDNHPEAQQVIKENLQNAGLFRQSKVLSMDAKAYLSMTKKRFDLAFLDPPYEKGILPEVLPQVTSVMQETGMILCEHLAGEILPEEVGGFSKQKEYRYGKVWVSVYQKL